MPETSTSTTASAGSHVAVFVFPFASHITIVPLLVRPLAVSSPTTLFSVFGTAQSNKAILSTCKKQNIRTFDVADGLPEGYVSGGNPEESIELFMNAAPVNFKKAAEAVEAETGSRFSCLMSDAFLWFAADIAAELEVPWVAFSFSAFHPVSAHVYTDLIREKIGLEGIEERLDERLEFIPGMSKVQVRDLPEGVLFGNLESPFSNMLHQMGRRLPQAAAVVLNCCDELDLTVTNDLKSKFKKLLTVGPCFLLSPPVAVPDTHGCLSWLDKQKEAASVAYVSFGTAVKLPPGELVAIAEALEASKVPFIWSLKDNFQVDLPNGFLERTRSHGIVVPWAPQVELLKRDAVGVFVTQSGWNSVLESIIGGVPMICRPFFGDHRIHARLLESVWEIGVTVEGGYFTKEGLMRSLDLVLREEDGKKMREKIGKLQKDLLNAIGPKGSSTENFKVLVDIVSRPKDA